MSFKFVLTENHGELYIVKMKRTICISLKRFVPDLVKIINGDEGNEVLVLQGEVGARDNPAWNLYILLFQPGAVSPGTGRQKFVNPTRSSGKTHLLAVWRASLVLPDLQPHFNPFFT
jgi:hypothetical protein